jgi:AcrR family transcriptional regulator
VPKITGGSLEEHRSQTRQAVFDALVRLLDRMSFDAVRMADLAAEAGVGRTAIYNHFRDKDAVIVGFATSETSKYLERLNAVLADARTPRDRLRAYVRHHIDTQGEQHFGFGPDIYGQLGPESRLAIRDHVLEIEDVVRTILVDGVATGDFREVDIDQVMRLVQACLQPRNVDADTVVDFVQRALLA